MTIEQMQRAVKNALELNELGATVNFSKAEFAILLRAAHIGLMAATGCVTLPLGNSAESLKSYISGGATQ